MESITQPQKYSLLLRMLHWLLAVLFIAIFLSGFIMVGLDEKIQTYKYDVYALHKSFGVITLALVALRICERLRSKIPPHGDKISTIEHHLANISHFLLYCFMVAVPLSGFMMSMFGGRGVMVFGYKLPQLTPINKELAGQLHSIHILIPYIMLGLIAIHILATIKHQYFDKVDILSRVLIKCDKQK